MGAEVGRAQAQVLRQRGEGAGGNKIFNAIIQSLLSKDGRLFYSYEKLNLKLHLRYSDSNLYRKLNEMQSDLHKIVLFYFYIISG